MPLSPTAEEARLATRELWFKSDEYFRAHFSPVEGEPYPLHQVETPGGLKIEKIEDALTVSAEYLKFIGGQPCDTTVVVEYPADIRDLPKISEDWQTEERAGTRTVPLNKFPQIVGELMELFEPVATVPGPT